MNNYIKISLVALSIYTLPFISFAQLEKTSGILTSVGAIVSATLIPIAFMAGLMFFFWGVAKYIRSAGSEKDEGKKIMAYGVVALFVMTSVWGIVTFLRLELGIGSDANMRIPTIGGRGGGEGANEGTGEGGP